MTVDELALQSNVQQSTCCNSLNSLGQSDISYNDAECQLETCSFWKATAQSTATFVCNCII